LTNSEPVLYCPTCYSTNFKLSRVRPADRLQMLFLRVPVRCQKCNARIYANRGYAAFLKKKGFISPHGRRSVKADSQDLG
jgi:hypothetical protein